MSTAIVESKHQSSLKARLAGRELVVGTFVKTPSPIVVEVLGRTTLDCLCLDAEHAPFDRANLDICIFAARAARIEVLVRVPTGAPEHLLNALDCGATGVMVPHVRSVAEAEAVLKAAHYGPRGRGYAGSSRAAGYTTVPMAHHRANSSGAGRW